MPRCGLPSWTFAEDGHTWSFVEIDTGSALEAEGRALSHCVATCHGRIAARQSTIWSMRRDGERCLTLEVWNTVGAVAQIRGMQNRRATPAEQRLVSSGGGARADRDGSAL